MRYLIEYLAVTSVSLIVRALPLMAVRRLGEALGLMFYLVDRVHRRIALANLEVAFPKKSEDECRDIARSMFQHFGRLLLELLKFSSLSRDRQLALVDWEGEERVRLALAHGKGILFCTGHFGFWEQQALAHARAWHPDLVLMDLEMPVMDGMQAMRLMRSNASLRGLRIIAVSATVNADAVRVGPGLEADAFLAKPLDRERLLREVAHQLGLVWITGEATVVQPS